MYSYEEYMRDVIGYPYSKQDIYENQYRNDNYNLLDIAEIEQCYPEIYKIVKPMIVSTCQIYTNQRITKETIDEMTMKIYSSIESREKRNNDDQNKPLKNGDVINPNVKRENRGTGNNYLLRDLIKILLINELKWNNHNRPPMPPPHHHIPGADFYPPYDRPPIRPF